MSQKFYQKATVQVAMVSGLVVLLVTAITICHQRSELTRENKRLNSLTQKQTAEIQRLETQLTPFKTIALEKYTGSEQDRMKKLAERIQELENPLKKTIASATANVEVIIKSDEEVNTIYMVDGGALCFVKDRQPLLLTSGTQSKAKQTGKGEIIYKGVFHMQPDHPSAGKPIEFLQASNLIQIVFVKIPEKSQVMGGKASVVINGDTRFEYEILPQQMRGNYIFIQNIKKNFLTKQSS